MFFQNWTEPLSQIPCGEGRVSSYKASYTWHTTAYAYGGNTLLLAYGKIYSTNVRVSKVKQARRSCCRKKNFCIDCFIYLAWVRTKNTDVWLITFTLSPLLRLLRWRGRLLCELASPSFFASREPLLRAPKCSRQKIQKRT